MYMKETDKRDVCLSAKIRILKQITTIQTYSVTYFRCLSQRKDKNFKANHNRFLHYLFEFHDVCLSAKIRILKQITTIQTYSVTYFRCLSQRKDKNFKANHNRFLHYLFEFHDVCLSAKIRILKQITTITYIFIILHLMFVLAQR